MVQSNSGGSLSGRYIDNNGHVEVGIGVAGLLAVTRRLQRGEGEEYPLLVGVRYGGITDGLSPTRYLTQDEDTVF